MVRKAEPRSRQAQERMTVKICEEHDASRRAEPKVKVLARSHGDLIRGLL